MDKITINMLSSAEKVAGQGVGSAFLEQVGLIKELGKNLFEVSINGKKETDILHHHTVDLKNYMKMKTTKGINVSYVHFLPHTLDGSIKLPKIAADVFKKYIIKFYKDADYLVVVNPIFIKDLEKYDIPKHKIVYIPNYVSKKNFYKKTVEECQNLKEKMGYTKDDFVVIGVGQVQHRKGILDFIDVAKKMPDIRFVWCGGFSFGVITDGYDELKKIYEKPPKNVKFLGIIPREEMNDMYNMADVLFMPSYNELFPMSILEAVNSEKPLLLRDLKLYENILFKKYLSSNNNDEFYDKLQKLMTDKELYKQYSQYSKEISEFYTKENIMKIWAEFYTRIHKEHLKKNNVTE